MRDPDFGPVEHGTDLELGQLPLQGARGGPERLDLAAAADPLAGPVAVVPLGRVDRQPAVEDDRVEPGPPAVRAARRYARRPPWRHPPAPTRGPGGTGPRAGRRRARRPGSSAIATGAARRGPGRAGERPARAGGSVARRILPQSSRPPRVAVGGLEQPDRGAERSLGAAGPGRLDRRPAVQGRVRRLGPDLPEDMGPLLAVEPFNLLVREFLRQAPLPAQRQQVPRVPARSAWSLGAQGGSSSRPRR